MAGLIPVIKFNRRPFWQLKLPSAVLVVLIFTSTLLALGQGKTYKTYEGEYFHSNLKKTSFSIEFPSDWEVDDILAGPAKGESVIIEFVSPAENPADDFREKLTLEIQDLHPRPLLRVYLKAHGIELPKLPDGFKKLQRGQAVIAGQQADYTIYTGVDIWEDKELKCKAYAFIIDETETIYTLTYSAEPKRYNKFLPVAEKIIKSVKLAVAVPIAGKREEDKEIIQLKTYKSRKFGQNSYLVTYSLDWELRELGPYNIGITSPSDVKVAVLVTVKDVRQLGYTFVKLDDYMKIYDENISNMMLNYEVAERTKTRFAGQDAYLTTYTYTDKAKPDWHVRSKTYTLLVGNIFAIEVGYTSTPEKFDQWLPKAESIIKSLRLLRVSKNEWKAYINEYYGFSVDYPADWKATVIPDATTNLMKNYMGESQIVFFTSPSEYPAGAVGETLSVSRKDLRNSPMSLDEYVKINDAKSSKALPDYLRLYDKKADIAGHEACLESYTYGGVKCRRYVLIVDDIVYALTFKASSEKYSKFLPKAEKIMKSFKLSLSAPVENFAMEPPQQGTIIPCEECVVLYPEKYKADPKSCPLCHGQREHFQTARMMNDELAAVEGHELELKVEDFLLRAVLDARKKPVPIETLREIRDFYREKLIFHLIYDKFELEPIKAHILELDELISKSK